MNKTTETPKPTEVSGLVMLDGPPTKQGWYWCCEAYSPYAMYVVWVFCHGGHNEHEMTFAEAAEMEAQWWGPIQAPKDPKIYGTAQPLALNLLAKKPPGLKISARGVLGRIRDGRYYEELNFGCGEMLRHMEKMACRYYAGDVQAVDEFLQLFCLDERRPSLE